MDSVWFSEQSTLLCEFLGLFLLFGFGLKFLFSVWFQWSLITFQRNGFCLRNVLDGNWVILRFFKDETEEKRDEKSDTLADSDREFDTENDVETEDVSELRKLIKLERLRVSAALAELEQERAASASAAAEAMAMILQLQNDKSSIELESNQHRRLALAKQIHDQQVIQSLQNLVWSHESGRRMLEHQFKSSWRKSNGLSNANERDGFEGDSMSSFGEIDDVLENVLYSSRSLDMNLWHERVLVEAL